MKYNVLHCNRQSSRLIWDSWNKNHIKKHNVATKEVEEAYKKALIEFHSYKGRIVYLGKTRKGRLLTIVVSFAKQLMPYVVSARDMSKNERRFYEKNKTFK